MPQNHDYLIKLIYFTIFSFFFPIYIQLFGSDSFTTGTAFVFILFFILAFKCILQKIQIKYFLFAFLLITISLISALSVDHSFLWNSLRSYVQFVSSILIFVIVFNVYSNKFLENLFTDVENIVFFLVLMVAVQILIGVIVQYIPDFGKHLTIFLTRNQSVLAPEFDGERLRMQTLIVGGEAVGECIAIFFPFVLYFLFYKNNFINYILLIIFLIGSLFAITRSSIILMLLSSIFFYVRIVFEVQFLSTIKGMFIALFLLFGVTYFFDTFLNELISRFSSSLSDYSRTGSVISAINREGVWFYIDKIVWPKLSFFGNGLVTISGNKMFHIHSLYVTILHQFGIVGFCIFMYFFISLLFKILLSYFSCSDRQVKTFLYSCFLSYSCFLINEIKFEFNRYDSYQKIIWTMFAVFALTSKFIKYKKC